MSVAHNIEDKERTDDVNISERIEFSGLFLSPHVLEGLTKSGFKRPSPIQLQAIPLGRCGLDLIVQAKSGTGKTCVFTVIALEGLNLQTDALQVLILSPTREIAIQIREVFTSIGSCMPELKCHSFIGGTSVQQDKISLKRCHVATGTPGRIKQLIELGMLKTQSIRLFVLDEADKLLGGDLTECINWIYSSLPDNKQILALSATYPEALAQHLTRYMRNPTFVRLNITDPALIGIKQYHVIVPDSPLPNKVFKAKTEAVIKILSFVSFEQCLIFSNLQTRAQSLQSELQSRNWPTQCIAGCLDQKDRSLAMEHLKAYKCRILISTDLTSRGIDADKVNMVINLDVPLDHETYLHRIGRAGRFGSHGAAISIVSKGKQEKELWAVERKCKTNIPKLPDPIPSDLATRYIALKLSDVVTTEKIITRPELPLKPSQQSSDQLQFGDNFVKIKETSDICDAPKEKEIEENSDADDNDKDTASKENCDNKDSVHTDEHENVQLVNTLEADGCNNSSPEFYSACDEKSLEEDSSEIHSVGSWLDLCGEDEKNQVHFSKCIKDGYVAFSRHSDLVSDKSSVAPSELLDNLSPVKPIEVVSGSNRADVQKYVQCNQVHKEICSDKEENVARHCASDMMETDKSQEIVSDSMKLSNGIHESNKTDKASNNDFPVVECSVLLGSASGDSIVNKASQIQAEPRDSKSCLQKAHKPKKQKHPRPFALSAFLKGLSETSTEVEDDDGVEDCVQLKLHDSRIEKEKDSTDVDMVGNDNIDVEPRINFANDIKELELFPNSVDSENLIQCIDLVISESPILSGFHRDDSELCDAAELTDGCCETDKMSPHQADKSIGQSFSQRQTETSPEKETLIIRDDVLHNSDESLNNNKSKKEDPFVFPSGGGNPKKCSELQKDFKNFSLNPRKVNMRDVSHSIHRQFSKIKLKPKVRESAIGFKTDRFAKLTEMKEDIRKMVEKTRLERIENPNTVKSFLNKIMSSKSTEMHNEHSPVQQHPGRNKSGKRKKVTGRSSAALDWRAKDNDNSDCRFKGKDDNDVGKIEGFGMTRHKNFDELLQEQLHLKKRTEARTNSEDKHNSEISDEIGQQTTTSTIELSAGATGGSLKSKSDHFHGARPKILNQLPSAIDRKKKSPTRHRVRGSPDEECQMLDKMHLEMLQKRKERKDQMAGLKLKAQSSNGPLDIGNSEPVTISPLNINITNVKDFAEMNSESIKNKVEFVSNICTRYDETASQCIEKNPVFGDVVSEQESFGKLKMQNDQGETTAKTTLEAKNIDDLLREQLLLKGKNAKRMFKNRNERFKCLSDGSDSRNVETTEPMAMSSKNEMIRPASCRSKSVTHHNGARPKTLHQSPNAIDRRHKSQLRAYGNSDKECQMLDKMHLEMLQKRKARKDQIAESKQKTSIENKPAANGIKAPLIVCPVTKKTTTHSGASNATGIDVDDSVENEKEIESSTSTVLEASTCSTEKEQNFSSGIVVPEQKLCEKLITQNDTEKTSAESRLEFRDTDNHTSHCAPSECCTHNKIESTCVEKIPVGIKSNESHVTKAHFKVLKFNVKGLDLSSDSDDLEVTLSSNTEVSDINSSDFSSCQKSEKIHVARKLKFAAESKSVRNRCNSSKSGTRFPTCHNPQTKSKSKKHLGKISVPVKNISNHDNDNVSSHESNSQMHMELNLSSNKSRSKSRSRTAYSSLNLPFRRPVTTASSAILSSFLPRDRERQEHVHKKVSENSNESNSMKYSKMKSGAKVHKYLWKHQCDAESDELSSSDEEIIDTFDLTSYNNWWPYWLSLYSHYVRSFQWPNSFTSFSPYNNQHHHLHHQPPMGPYYHYHHLATLHHPPHHCYPHAMTDYANQYQHFYDNQKAAASAASLQQKYIRHMAHVMQKMSHRYAREQSEKKRSENG